MRNGTKLRHLLAVCDMHLTMDDDGNIIVTTISKTGLGRRRKEAVSFSSALDKAYRQVMKDLKEGTTDTDA